MYKERILIATWNQRTEHWADTEKFQLFQRKPNSTALRRGWEGTEYSTDQKCLNAEHSCHNRISEKDTKRYILIPFLLKCPHRSSRTKRQSEIILINGSQCLWFLGLPIPLPKRASSWPTYSPYQGFSTFFKEGTPSGGYPPWTGLYPLLGAQQGGRSLGSQLISRGASPQQPVDEQPGVKQGYLGTGKQHMTAQSAGLPCPYPWMTTPALI